jgi:hypothetical protein
MIDNNADDARTTGEPATDDPYQEGPNSTVDDWLGQQVQRDSERVDELLAEEHGDVAQAEQRFDAEARTNND